MWKIPRILFMNEYYEWNIEKYKFLHGSSSGSMMCTFATTHLANCDSSKWTHRVESRRAGGKYTPKGGRERTCSSGKNRLKQQSLAALTFQQRGRRCKVKLARPISKVLLHRRESGLSLFSHRLFVGPARIHVWANCKLSEHSARVEGREGRLAECVPPLDVLQLWLLHGNVFHFHVTYKNAVPRIRKSCRSTRTVNSRRPLCKA